LDEAIDAPAAPAIEAYLAGKTMDSEQESRLAAYVMAHDLRSPKARDFLLGQSQKFLDQLKKEMWKDRERVKREIFDEAGLLLSDELYDKIAESVRYEIQKPHWLETMQRQVNTGAERLFGLEWIKLAAPDGLEFLTSDVGVVKFWEGFARPAPHTIGWWNQADHWVMPLSPKYAIAFGRAHPRYRNTADARPGLVKRLNRLLVDQARRWVYTRRQEPFVPRWIAARQKFERERTPDNEQS
jgi:hypothetical protein